MLAAIGDLVEDIIVYVRDPLALGSDASSRIIRRRGGAAANTLVAAARHDGRKTRFIGQVGADAAGDMLCAIMEQEGVELAVHRRGRAGTVIVLVNHYGERTMLPDPGSAQDLSDPRKEWLDGVRFLHIPAYSLIRHPMDVATLILVSWASDAGIPISVDASSSALIERFGTARMIELLRTVAPQVFLLNEQEADVFGERGLADIGAPIVVVKRGADPAEVRVGEIRASVAAHQLGEVKDTTGAGDAFAGGFLGALLDGADPVSAATHGHRVAAAMIQR